jgi:hypothetical protein
MICVSFFTTLYSHVTPDLQQQASDAMDDARLEAP